MICTRVLVHFVSLVLAPPFRDFDHATIDGLARVGNAPAIFARTSRYGLPYVSILACSSLSLFAYMGIKATPGKVFGWFANSEYARFRLACDGAHIW